MEDQSTEDSTQNIVGTANEAPVEIENIGCMALLDTGSQVTTLSESFYLRHFGSYPLNECRSLLRLESAGGQIIPYRGFFVACVRIDGMEDLDIPILVVEDTAYNSSVPFLIGTNVLSRLKVQSAGKPHSNLTLAIQAVLLAERHLSRSRGVYGTVYQDEDCIIPSGEVHTVCGNIRVSVPISSDFALLSTDGLDTELTVTPTLMRLSTDVRRVNVEVINSKTSPIFLQKGDIIAQFSRHL